MMAKGGSAASSKKKGGRSKAPVKKVIRKVVKAKAPVKKKASAKAKPAVRNVSALKEKMTKSAVLGEISTQTSLSRAQVSSVFEELEVIIGRHIKKRSVGEFTLPGLLKIKKVSKPAKKARKGVPNPFRPGELMDVAAKPASSVVRVAPLKKLKDMTTN